MQKWFYIMILFTTVALCPSRAQEVRGIDVSHHQKQINWNLVSKDNISFVYVKATEGKTYKDPRFDENIKGALKVGLPVGAYHYFRMTSGAREQFYNFRKALKNYTCQLIPMVDVETSDGRSVRELRDSLDVFISLIKAEYGCAPMIYGTQRSYNTYCAPRYNGYHLYIGRYGANEPVIKGKGTYSIWQYTESGKVKGIHASVDICKFNPKYTLSNIRMPGK